MNTELNPYEVALVTHVLVPMFKSLSAESQVIALTKCASEGLYHCEFGEPLPEKLIQELKDVITKNEVLKDDDKLSETLFGPPTKELDV